MHSQSPKWLQQPGWRIEQKYVPGVLVGNWYENRQMFQRGTLPSASTYRTVYKPYKSTDCPPDTTTRAHGVLMNCGLEKKFLFTHHGSHNAHNFTSFYHQDYTKRYSPGTRQWDRHRLIWSPEKSDHPLEGESIRYGLKEQIEEKWKKLKELETHGDYTSTYQVTYRSNHTSLASEAHPLKSTARNLSTHLHPHNLVKSLHLRDVPLIVRPEVVDPKYEKNKLCATV
eukprot:Em0008g61a